MKSVVIVADHTCVIEAIRNALRQTTGIRVLGFLDVRLAVTDAMAEAAPDVVLVDEMHQPDHALARLREIRERSPESHRILLTTRMDGRWLADAVDAGATAAISKGVHPATLGMLVRETAYGNMVHVFESDARRAAELEECMLTDRELEILALVAQGHTNGKIAGSLWVTEQTVKFHLSNVYRKLGVSNRTEASHWAHQHDLVSARPVALAS